jgi:hypothetical protein
VIKLVRKDGKFPIRFITMYPMFIHREIQSEKKEIKNEAFVWEIHNKAKK